MKFILFLLLIVSFLKADDPYKDIEFYKLDNGMDIYLLEDDKSKNVSITTEVKVGMKAEDKETAGISHLVEHIIFRDGRVDGRDYYNLIKDKGATYVNGYTSHYKTQYVTTINPENAQWITKTFYKMLFDKNVTDEDLRVEKGALQIEIGEPTWVDYIAPDLRDGFNLVNFVKKIFPPSDNVYEKDFGIDYDKDKIKYQSSLTYKLNNKKFTLKEVIEHYHNYYYPSNISLKIVGKFDKKEIKKLIDTTFAKVKKRDAKSVKEPIIKDAKLDNKPHESYVGGYGESGLPSIVIGAKFLQDDPKKMLVLKAYMDNLADRLLKKFRNKQGEAYGVHGDVQVYRNAAIAAVSFSSPHDAFDKNVKIVKSWIKKEANGDINDTIIQEAIKQRKNKYDAKEHDVRSLMDSVDSYIYYHRFFKDAKNPYVLLKEITPSYFKSILSETFKPEHSYMMIERDYFLFPYDGALLIILSNIIFGIYFAKFIGARVKKRDIRLKRSLSNWFVSLLIILMILLFVILLDEWFFYITSFIVNLQEKSYDIPISYLLICLSLIVDIAILYVVVKVLFSWYYRKLFVTDSELILVGSHSKYIKLEDITGMDVVSYFPRPWGKVYGNSILFWRPLLKISTKDAKVYYLRSSNASHLKEDIEKVYKQN